MSTLLAPSSRNYWISNESLLKQRVRRVLERLRNRQLREGSAYSYVRGLIPFLALFGVWLRLIHWTPVSDWRLVINRSETVRHLLMAFVLAAVWNVWHRFSPYQRRTPKLDVLAEAQRVFWAATACGCVLFVLELTRCSLRHSLQLGAEAGVGLDALALLSLAAFGVAAALSPRLLPKRAAIVVGSGNRAALLKAKLHNQSSRVEVYGCVDDEYVGGRSEQDSYLGPISELPKLLKQHPIEIVLIGLPMRSQYDAIQRVIGICETVGVESHYMQDIFETGRSRARLHTDVPHEFGVLHSFVPDARQDLKRAFDCVGAGLLLLLLSPVMITAAAAILITSAGPVIFVQQRYGLHRQRFPMFKFRSMVVDAEARQADLEALNEASGPVFKMGRDPRVTAVGNFLRKTSIDELPQLFNVLRGEMSLVGPRPLPQRDV